MARREWFDVPDTTSPLSASLLNDLEARKPEMEHMSLNVKEPPFNAVGDGVSDDTIAIQAAIDALPLTGNNTTTGGVIFFPEGMYKVSAPLDIDGMYNVTFKGSGSGWGASTLSPTAATATVISARSTLGFRFDSMAILAPTAVWSGTSIDLTGDVFSSADTTLFSIEHCHFNTPSQVASGVLMLNLRGATVGRIVKSYFAGGGVHIKGRTVVGDFSNIINIEDNLFDRADEVPIKNPYYSWNITGNTFEPLRDGTCGAVKNEASIPVHCCSFIGNWCGDSSASGTWLDVHGRAFTAINNLFSVGGTGFKLSAASTGVTSIGNSFHGLTTGHDFSGFSHNAVTVSGNYYTSVTTPISGNEFGTGSLVVDSDCTFARQSAAAIQTNSKLWLSGGQAGFMMYALSGATNFIIQTRRGSDTNDLFMMNGLGTMEWSGGGAPAEIQMARVSTTQPTLKVTAPFTLPTYTTATKPAAANVSAGTVIFVSDGGAGAVFQGSTGAAWVNLG